MKRIFYIACFGFFGLLVATLIHAGVEMVALAVIFGNPAHFAESVWWQEWKLIHGVVGAVLWAIGLALGLYAGIRFWDIVYVQHQRQK